MTHSAFKGPAQIRLAFLGVTTAQAVRVCLTEGYLEPSDSSRSYGASRVDE